MARVVFALIGSLGDLHPVLAVATELRRRGHAVTIATSSCYREKILRVGLGFHPLRPEVPFVDPAFVRGVMAGFRGAVRLLRDFLMPAAPDTYADLAAAVAGADLLVTSELIYVARSVAEVCGVRWVSYSLAPLSMLSNTDPRIPPVPWAGEWLRALPPTVLRGLTLLPRVASHGWWRPIRRLRRKLHLPVGPNPIFEGKFSPRLDLALFSREFGAPQPDWPPQTRQTGFCYYDETELQPDLPPPVAHFLAAGEPPIVFTLGSAAVYLANDFYAESVLAARQLSRRALLLLGPNPPPAGLPPSILAWDYLPYREVFARAAVIVHQGGIGTTAQALRAGRPMIVLPFAYDQFDNAAQARRLGVSRVIPRRRYRARIVAAELSALLGDPQTGERAAALGRRIRDERGTEDACAALEAIL